jgi:hypothetical protein
MTDNPIVPIKEVRTVELLDGRKRRVNICIDRDGRECVSTVSGYNLVSKDGKRVLKRKANIWN